MSLYLRLHPGRRLRRQLVLEQMDLRDGHLRLLGLLFELLSQQLDLMVSAQGQLRIGRVGRITEQLWGARGRNGARRLKQTKGGEM